jgi:hypothetical protein
VITREYLYFCYYHGLLELNLINNLKILIVVEMAKVKCQQYGQEIVGGANVQHFDVEEPTTIHVFCSEKCKSKWITSKEK